MFKSITFWKNNDIKKSFELSLDIFIKGYLKSKYADINDQRLLFVKFNLYVMNCMQCYWEPSDGQLFDLLQTYRKLKK